MKLVLFTPALTKSSIGGACALVEAELLRQGHEITIVRTEDIPLLDTVTHPFESKIVRWDDQKAVTDLLAGADAVAYEIGNNYPFHRGSLEWLPRVPGVVCLHDFFVAYMFRTWAEQHHRQAETILRAWYGQDVAEQFFVPRNDEEFIAYMSANAPMTEWIASMASGVITHSNWSIQRVLRACPGPIEVVALTDRMREPIALSSHSSLAWSYPHTNGRTKTDSAAGFDASWPDSGNNNGNGAVSGEAATYTVLTIGHMIPNKRQESVIRALGASPLLRTKAHYQLAGTIEPYYAQQLSELARSLQVRLTIMGAVDDATMTQAIEQASVVCCLRYPVLESASGSVVEAMMDGKPIIVTDIGFYRELPDDCVCKVSLDHEIDDLQRVLETLYAHPEQRQQLGALGAAWARETFSAAKYAERLAHMCKLAAKAAPAIEASRYFAETLTRWGASEEILTSSEIPSFLTPLGSIGSVKSDNRESNKDVSQ